jgi:uncharacterized protein YegL
MPMMEGKTMYRIARRSTFRYAISLLLVVAILATACRPKVAPPEIRETPQADQVEATAQQDADSRGYFVPGESELDEAANATGTAAEATAHAQATTTAVVEATADAFVVTYGIAASFTDDLDYAAIAVHKNGEKLVAMTETDESGNVINVTGAVWLSPDGDAFVVYNSADGLPERAVFGDYIVLFLSYSDDSVDVALISPDGSTQVTKDVPVDPEQLSQLQARGPSVGVLASPINRPYQGDGLSLVETLKLAALGISVAGCVTAVIMSAGIAAPLCAAAVVSAVSLLVPEDNVALSATGKSLGAIGCGGLLDTGSCISLALDITADVASLANQDVESQEPAISRAQEQVFAPRIVTVSFAGDASACPPQVAAPALDVALVIDVSGSMEGARLAAAKSSAINFIRQLNPETDRVGLVVFTGDASVLSQLSGDFGSIAQMIGGLKADDGTAIHKGLAAGHGVLQGSGRPDAMPAVLLLSDGQSDPDAAQAAASQIKADKVTLLAVGVGKGTDQGLLGSLAGAPADFLYSNTNQGLRELFSETALRLTTGRILARDVTMTLQVDTGHYEIVESMLTHGAKVMPLGVVEWKIPVVYADQTVMRPLVVRPLTTRGAPVGRLSIAYGECQDGPRITLEPTSVEPVSYASDIWSDEVLGVGAASSGSLGAFDSQGWVIDVEEAGIYSVIVEGAGSELAPEIFTGDGDEYLYPLYSLSTLTGGTSALPGRAAGLSAPAMLGDGRINVYFIEDPKLYWFYLQSNGPADSGPYTLKLEAGAVDKPPVIQAGDEVREEWVEDGESRVYELQGVSEGESITAVISHPQEDSYTSAYLVSLDGERAGPRYSLAGRENKPSVFALKAPGKGTYRLVIYYDGQDGPGNYTLHVERGDALAIQKGQIKFGQAVAETLQPGRVDTWEFEGNAGDGVRLTLNSPDGRETQELTLLGPDGDEVSWDSDREEATIGPLALAADGTYTIIVQYSYNSDSSGSYRLSLESVELPEPVLKAITPGESVSGTIIEGRKDNWTFEAASGQTVTIMLKSSDAQLDPQLALLGPDGDPVKEIQSYYEQAQLGPMELAEDGVYTIAVSGYYSGGPYELTLILSKLGAAEDQLRR